VVERMGLVGGGSGLLNLWPLTYGAARCFHLNFRAA